jgi:hypothetical protein
VRERVVDWDAVARGDRKPAAVRCTVMVQDDLTDLLPYVPGTITAPADGDPLAVGNRSNPVRRQVQPREHPRYARCNVEAEHIGKTVVVKDRDVDRDDQIPGDCILGEIGDTRLAGRHDASYCIGVRGYRQLLAERHPRVDDFLTREVAQDDSWTILLLARLGMERREVAGLQMF